MGSAFQQANSFNGTIDDVIIWNRSLSANEVSQLYKSQLTQYDTDNKSFQYNTSISAISTPYQLFISNSTNQISSTLNSISFRHFPMQLRLPYFHR
jgi:hypothetical protein